jgi:hypothetical protein
LEVRVRGTKAADANGLDRSLTADTTTGGGKEVALQVFGLEGSVAELNADNVVFRSTGWSESADLADLTGRFDQALRPEKSSGKFLIISWRTHRHGERLSVDTDLKGLFGCKMVFDAAGDSVRPFGHMSQFEWRLDSWHALAPDVQPKPGTASASAFLFCQKGSESGIGLLVDKVANIREDTFTQVHAQEARTERGSQVFFKILKHERRQVRLLPKQTQQRSAIGWAFVVAGQAASWTYCQREGNRSWTGLREIGWPGYEIDSHAGMVTPVSLTLNGTDGGYLWLDSGETAELRPEPQNPCRVFHAECRRRFPCG